MFSHGGGVPNALPNETRAAHPTHARTHARTHERAPVSRPPLPPRACITVCACAYMCEHYEMSDVFTRWRRAKCNRHAARPLMGHSRRRPPRACITVCKCECAPQSVHTQPLLLQRIARAGTLDKRGPSAADVSHTHTRESAAQRTLALGASRAFHGEAARQALQ